MKGYIGLEPVYNNMRFGDCKYCNEYKYLTNDVACEECVEQPDVKKSFFNQLVQDVEGTVDDDVSVNPDEANGIIFVRHDGSESDKMHQMEDKYEGVIVTDKKTSEDGIIENWIQIPNDANIQ